MGRFRLEKRLGAGAFGTVYRAADPVLGRAVAVKTPQAGVLGKPDAVRRFLIEAKAAAKLRHPNIVPVYEAGVEEGRPYFVSAYIPGHTLAAEVDEQPMPPRQAAAVVRKLAEALAYAHREKVVHRDIKPSNIMVDALGEPLIMDFGLARFVLSEGPDDEDAGTGDAPVAAGDAIQTHVGAFMGTAPYMAPEQALSSGQADALSDQYSLGATLYELLTGRTPFAGPVEIVRHNVLHQEPPPVRSLIPAVPRDLAAICAKAMSKARDRRYADCQALADDLRRFLDDESTVARPMSPLRHFQRWYRHQPGQAAAAVLTLAALGAVALLATGFWIRERHDADQQKNNVENQKRTIQRITETDARNVRLLGESQASEEKAKQAAAEVDRQRAEAVRATATANLRYLDSLVQQAQREKDAGNLLTGAGLLLRALTIADAEKQTATATALRADLAFTTSHLPKLATMENGETGGRPPAPADVPHRLSRTRALDERYGIGRNENGETRLFDRRTGTLVGGKLPFGWMPSVEDGLPFPVAVNADGSRVAFPEPGGSKPSLRVIETATLKNVGPPVPAPPTPCEFLRLDPKGTTLLVVARVPDTPKRLRWGLYNTAKGMNISKSNEADVVEVSPDASRLVIFDRGLASLYSFEKGELLQKYVTPELRPLALTPTGSWLFGCRGADLFVAGGKQRQGVGYQLGLASAPARLWGSDEARAALTLSTEGLLLHDLTARRRLGPLVESDLALISDRSEGHADRVRLVSAPGGALRIEAALAAGPIRATWELEPPAHSPIEGWNVEGLVADRFLLLSLRQRELHANPLGPAAPRILVDRITGFGVLEAETNRVVFPSQKVLTPLADARPIRDRELAELPDADAYLKVAAPFNPSQVVEPAYGMAVSHAGDLVALREFEAGTSYLRLYNRDGQPFERRQQVAGPLCDDDRTAAGRESLLDPDRNRCFRFGPSDATVLYRVDANSLRIVLTDPQEPRTFDLALPAGSRVQLIGYSKSGGEVWAVLNSGQSLTLRRWSLVAKPYNKDGVDAPLPFDGVPSLMLAAVESHRLFFGTANGQGRLFDLDTGAAVGSVAFKLAGDEQPTVRRCWFSPDGTILCAELANAADQSAGYALVRAQDGQVLPSPSGQGAVGSRLPIIADGHPIILRFDAGATPWRRSVELWDVARNAAHGRPLHHPVPVKSLQLAREGQLALTTDVRDESRLWDVPTGLQVGPVLNRLVLWRPGLTTDRRFVLLPTGRSLLAVQEGRYVATLAVPDSSTEDVETLRRQFCDHTGHDLDDNGLLRLLDPETWSAAREQSHEPASPVARP